MIRRRLRDDLPACGLALAALLAASMGVLAAGTAPASSPASIPFADHNGIRDWEADGTQGLWVQDNSRKWYYGKFNFPCTGLQFKTGLRFKFSPDGSFDRWSEVSTPEAGRCTLKTFAASAGPPAKTKSKAAATSAAPATPAAPPAPAVTGG
jgi:hypothetical protein